MSKKGKAKKYRKFHDPFTMVSLKRDIKEGVSYSVNWKNWGTGKHANTTAIHWRPPFDPTYALARSIIDKVHARNGPMPLELDGHLYLIQEVHGKLVPNDLGGVDLEPYEGKYVPRHASGTVKAKKKTAGRHRKDGVAQSGRAARS